MKYKEEELLKQIHEYIESTYGQHYVGKNNVQSLDVIFSSGHGEGFCIGSIIKYAARYGKKKGKNRADLMKIVHYAILMLYLHDLEGDIKAVELAEATHGRPLESVKKENK